MPKIIWKHSSIPQEDLWNNILPEIKKMMEFLEFHVNDN